MNKPSLRFCSRSLLGPIGLSLLVAASLGGCSAGGTQTSSPAADDATGAPAEDAPVAGPEVERAEIPAPRTTAPAAQAGTSAKPAVAAGPPLPPKIATALAGAAVTERDYVRRELYTWTTAKQARLLAQYRFLISRRSTFGSVALFDTRLRRRPRSDKLAKLLFSKGLDYRRFGWSNSWAARLGHDGEGFGDQLVKVRLKEDAWVARFDTRVPGHWEVHDLQGKPVEVAQVLAQPSRLAAIYHVWHGDEETDPLPSSELAFREYVLCNESMIERWEMGTQQLRKQMKRDASLLRKLAQHFDRSGRRKPASVTGYNHHADNRVWSLPAAEEPSYEAALAFAGEPYLPTAKALNTVADTLARDVSRQSLPLSHRPIVAFGTAPPKALVQLPATRRFCDVTMMMPCK